MYDDNDNDDDDDDFETDAETETARYFTFVIGKEMFAIGITETTGVREVLNQKDITVVPGLPKCLPGLINVRGNVISTVDLRLILGMPPNEMATASCFVIVDMELDGESLQLGILADSVREVTDFSGGKMEPAPTLGTNMRPEYVCGVTQCEKESVFVLNIERIVRDIEKLITGVPEETK